MRLSTQVYLPKSQAPVFPDRCVACGYEHPADRVEVSTISRSRWAFTPLMFWVTASRINFEAPICSPCRQRMIWNRRLRETLLYVLVVVAILIHLFAGPFGPWLFAGILLACMLPAIVWMTLFSLPIDLTDLGAHETLLYEFRDARYADEFKTQNDGKSKPWS